MIVAEVRLHPRPFTVAVTGAALFALCTVASSGAIRWVIDNVIVPRFEEGAVATSTVLAGVGMVIGIGLLPGGTQPPGQVLGMVVLGAGFVAVAWRLDMLGLAGAIRRRLAA